MFELVDEVEIWNNAVHVCLLLSLFEISDLFCCCFTFLIFFPFFGDF